MTLSAIREITQRNLKPLVNQIDREGLYPTEVLRHLARKGAMSAHLEAPFGDKRYEASIRAIAAVSQICGTTGFLMWCHAVCGLYLERAPHSALHHDLLREHVSGERLGGTALSNPMKSFAKIEQFLLKATPVPGGYRVSGSLPWVSHLGPGHYCGAIAAVQPHTEDREIMFLLRTDSPGVTLTECPSFSGMEGTGTFGLALDSVLVTEQDLIADPARPLIQNIRAAFVLLQCGMGLGVTQGAIDSMREVEAGLGHVNQFLDDQPAELQSELDRLWLRIADLAENPFQTEKEYWIDVLDARAHCAELCLRAAQSALLHQGARGYLMRSDVQRRVRESHFVAIVTPAIKHLRSEIHRLSAVALPA